MTAGLRYILAALCLGWCALWASETLFWSFPRADMTLPVLVWTWLTYALLAAAALSAVIWSGLEGWRAGFLGGALLGYGGEGAVVGTIYDAVPFQLVWTPLAWHALISGLWVLAVGLRLPRGPVWRQAAGLVLLGLFGAVWALFWPAEQEVAVGLPAMLVYQPLAGLGVGLAFWGLSRSGTWPEPRWWMGLAPLGVFAFWAAQVAMGPSPLHLLGLAMPGLTLWVMRRLGRRDGAAALFGPPLPLMRALSFALAPLIVALLAVPGWAALGGLPTNIAVALISSALGLGLWLWLLWRALWRPA